MCRVVILVYKIVQIQLNCVVVKLVYSKHI